MARRSRHFSLKRRGAVRNPRARITIISEGALTEPAYFRALAQCCRTLIDLEGPAGVPMSVVNRAIELLPRKTGARDNSFEKNDEIWAVFDRDEHPQYAEAINKAKAAGIHVGYSDPCFELWLVLHYRNWDSPIDRRKIQAELRRLMPAYDPGKSKVVDFDAIRDHVQEAEKRAKRLEDNRAAEGNAYGNPSTSVFELTLQIRIHGR
jgi:hypothetical protein